jgi:hypothetical protein
MQFVGSMSAVGALGSRMKLQIKEYDFLQSKNFKLLSQITGNSTDYFFKVHNFC